jgi:hypothetical protein
MANMDHALSVAIRCMTLYYYYLLVFWIDVFDEGYWAASGPIAFVYFTHSKGMNLYQGYAPSQAGVTVQRYYHR